MRSENVFYYFPPIKFEEPLAALNKLTNSLSTVVKEFSELPEEEKASFTYPQSVAEMKRDYMDSPNGKNSESFKNFNTVIAAINILKSCARVNMAIYALRDKCIAKENVLGDSQSLTRYMSRTENLSSDVRSVIHKSEISSLPYSNDPEIIRVKNTAIETRDMIHGYNSKYTVIGFEEVFISTVKYQLYDICKKFKVETRTVTERVSEAGGNAVAYILLFGILVFLLILVGKCATGQ